MGAEVTAGEGGGRSGSEGAPPPTCRGWAAVMALGRLWVTLAEDCSAAAGSREESVQQQDARRVVCRVAENWRWSHY